MFVCCVFVNWVCFIRWIFRRKFRLIDWWIRFCVKVSFASINFFVSQQIYFILAHNVDLDRTCTLINYAILWPSNGRETFICVEKYKNLVLMRNPHFPLVSSHMTVQEKLALSSPGYLYFVCLLLSAFSVCWYFKVL